MTQKTLEQITKFKQKSRKIIRDALSVGVFCALVGAGLGNGYHFATREFMHSRTSPEYQEYIKSYNNLNNQWENVTGTSLRDADRNMNPRDIIFHTGLVETKTNIYKIIPMGTHWHESFKVDSMTAPGQYNITVTSDKIIVQGFKNLFAFRPDLKTPKLEYAFKDTTNKYIDSINPENKLLTSRTIEGTLTGVAVGIIGVMGRAFKTRKEENYKPFIFM